MRVFVTGASGFIGSAVVQELLAAGHQVTGLARSDASAKKLTAAGAQVHRGSLDDLDSLKAGAAAADGVIHLAFIHDFSDYAGSGRTDFKAVEAMGAALAGTGKPLVVTSGTMCFTPGKLCTEDSPADPNSMAAPRVPTEALTLGLASKGVRSSVMRLPPSVHGEEDTGFVPALIGIARQKGVAAYVGDGSARWPAVHRLDAALCFRLALEKGTAGSRYHAVADEVVPVKDIAEAIGRQIKVPVVSKSREEAMEHFGFFGLVLAVDNPAESKLTQERLGWHPRHIGLIADIDAGHYFKS